jgi:hypothetical protein
MKRVVLLILVLLLVIDLGQDGHIGKATFVPADSAAKPSLTSPPQYDCGNVDSHYTRPVANYWEMSGRCQFQPIEILVQPALKIITYCHTGRSGGLPL